MKRSHLIGRTLDEVKAIVKKEGFTLRIAKLDGVKTPPLTDAHNSRVNVVVENGIVTQVVSVG
jgi:hypothetical protein